MVLFLRVLEFLEDFDECSVVEESVYSIEEEYYDKKSTL